ncbi:cupin domain-containing protein [Kiloniella antarctica]|uniref:Cupin domain-containing protein n=1 Tax=Kiloniella antarctica TaxID=1550907 RepID=A0ABW5BJ31_9PROT
MAKIFNNFHTITLSTVLVASLSASIAFIELAKAGETSSSTKLLTAQFEPRHVVQVEVGDFHFKPGQTAPLHTHTAPAVGYVAKGEIIYQIEGGKPQFLSAGDAFYEPVGPKIVRFDNASATEEAVFLDFNLEQEGEPFIVFLDQPTETIDRRTLPTIDIVDKVVSKVDVFENNLLPAGSINPTEGELILGIVAEGIIEFTTKGGKTKRIIAGKSFAIPAKASGASIINASTEVPAKVITYTLK